MLGLGAKLILERDVPLGGDFCGALQYMSLHEISLRLEGDQPVDLTRSVANLLECEGLGFRC